MVLVFVPIFTKGPNKGLLISLVPLKKGLKIHNPKTGTQQYETTKNKLLVEALWVLKKTDKG